MKLYACQCGNEQAMGTMAPPPCDGCRTCRTNLSKERLVDHEFMNEIAQSDEGPEMIARCTMCHRTQRELDEAR